jgi:hypothetical protein
MPARWLISISSDHLTIMSKNFIIGMHSTPLMMEKPKKAGKGEKK